MGSENRKEYAARHLRRFMLFVLGFGIYSIISCVFRIDFAADIVIEAVGIVGVAISTINIKL